MAVSITGPLRRTLRRFLSRVPWRSRLSVLVFCLFWQSAAEEREGVILQIPAFVPTHAYFGSSAPRSG
jgi:hypothetical protein